MPTIDKKKLLMRNDMVVGLINNMKIQEQRKSIKLWIFFQ